MRLPRPAIESRPPNRSNIWWRGRWWAVREACRVVGIHYNTFYLRRKAGWSVAAALETEVMSQRQSTALARQGKRRPKSGRLPVPVRRADVLVLIESVKRLAEYAERLLQKLPEE